MIKTKKPLDVVVSRGSLVESRHDVMVAFWHVKRGLIGYAGNYDFLTLPRSTVKFLQAIPFVESEAYKHYGLDETHLALACASHHGEKIHIDKLKLWMEKIQVQESDLACGPHLPNNMMATEEILRRGEKPLRLHNNCSGKHLGFLSTCQFLKEPLKDYHLENHPQQRRVRQVLSEAFGLDLQKSMWGVDGCGIPTYGIPLQNLARGMSLLIDPSQKKQRIETCQMILAAVKKHPELVSGTQDWTYKTMVELEGKVYLKTGAEGVVCGLIPEQELGFAVKCVDGQSRGAMAACIEILKAFSLFSVAKWKSSQLQENLQIKNTRQEVVGDIRVFTKND